MSWIAPVGGSVDRPIVSAGARNRAPAAGSIENAAPLRAVATEDRSGSVAEDLADYAFRSQIDRVRLLEWVERIRQSDRGSSWLVERPGPDADRLGYPSAAEAYREMSAAVAEL
jgi:hypothetical protein